MFFDVINMNLKNNMNLLFFSQRFLELTSYFSSESYKSKMMMCITLCEEYKKTYNLNYENSKKENLKIISEELIESIKKDSIAKKLLKFKIDNYLKRGLNDYTNISRQYSVIKLISQELYYISYIHNSIDEIDSKINDRNKTEVVHIMNNLISLLNYLGIKNSYLFYSCKEYFSNIKNLSIKDFFNNYILNKESEYEVYIGIRKIPRFLNEEFLNNLGVSCNILDKTQNPPLKGFYTVIKFNKIKSDNPYNAIENALHIIDRLKEAYSVFNHSKKIVVGNTHMAIDNESKSYSYKNEISAITHQQKKDILISEAKKFENFFHNFNLHNDSFAKFNKAIKLHSDAINNTSMENQLIFFWNALETLSSKNNNNSIINNVENFILPFIRKRYFITNFTYIFNTAYAFKKELIKDTFKLCSLELNAFSFAQFIILNKFKEERASFLNTINKDFPLLIDRIYILNKQLSEPIDVLRKLESHEENVKKQLRRIYRHRNLITHNDSNEIIIHTLLSNLHNYFDYVMEEIIDHSCNKKTLNIEELGLLIEMEISQNKIILEQNKEINETNFNKIFMLD
ncbi:hypothetical protein [Arcobacter sp.]|uniref:hypothetical protein n=1 Tax=Arcobacter sp. TaxID=1872629 RepID=UPI003D0C47D1